MQDKSYHVFIAPSAGCFAPRRKISGRCRARKSKAPPVVAPIYNWGGNRDFHSVPVLGGAFLFIDGIKQNVDMGTVRVNSTFGGPIVATY